MVIGNFTDAMISFFQWRNVWDLSSVVINLLKGWLYWLLVKARNSFFQIDICPKHSLIPCSEAKTIGAMLEKFHPAFLVEYSSYYRTIWPKLYMRYYKLHVKWCFHHVIMRPIGRIMVTNTAPAGTLFLLNDFQVFFFFILDIIMP